MGTKRTRTKAGRAAPSAAGAARTRWRAGRWLLVLLALTAGGLATYWWNRRAHDFALTRSSDQNVLIVTIDTLRADVLGAYGGHVATPHLDALSARGARFTFAHAHTVLTLPSHASIFTGRYPYEHGVRDNA